MNRDGVVYDNRLNAATSSMYVTSPTTSSQLMLADVDIPASPNGSSALHAAVAAALPSQVRLRDYFWDLSSFGLFLD